MRMVLRWIFKFCSAISRGWYKFIVMPFKRSMLSGCGKKVNIGKNSSITYNNVCVGNNVSIGCNAMLLSSVAKIKIGNNVMFGPHVFMITGDHRTDILGKYMIDVKEEDKLPENDQDIIIEDDVWIGANAIILKGVTVGEGSIVAAGSVVTQNIPSYSIAGGIPAKVIRMRFSEAQIEKHKRIIKSKVDGIR